MGYAVSDRPYIAHLSEDGNRVQLLSEHLENTAHLAGQFGERLGLEAAASALGAVHDAGKFQEEFQNYIRGEYKGRVDHSTAGALILQMRNYSPAMNLMGPFCIAGHHAGLPDLGSRADSSHDATMCGRLKKGMEHKESYLACGKQAALPQEVDVPVFSQIQRDRMDVMLLTRMLFSCLVDADFLDTEAFMSEGAAARGGFSSIETLHDRFFSKLEEKGYFRPQNRINEKRCDILKRCMAMGTGQPGLYSLTVPTGGGKTVSSLAFAMKQAVANHKRRIIYVIPYLSIIEQTEEVFRSFLGKENVLESHSNVSYDDETENVAERKKLAAENWDAPVIITTSEQFWESLYANRTSKCRKLHNIADSVIIFDESQMLPREFLLPCLKALEGLIRYFGCTAVLCSATQPHLDDVMKAHHMDLHPTEIMEGIPELYEFFRRVRFQDDGEKTYDEIANAMQQVPQALCIALTKSEAKELADRITGDGAFYLSTNLCPAHRKSVIREMKQRLREGLPCRVVSTSVISVGVDIDFPEVYLEKTGADSLIQGAGRCNREGKRPLEDSIVYIFETEKSASSRFMRTERELMRKTMETVPGGDISSPEAVRYYFSQLYSLHDYGEESGLDQAEIRKLAQAYAYREIGKRFHLIDGKTKSVLIPYDEAAREIIAQLRLGIRTRDLLRRAAQYMVSVSDVSPRTSLFAAMRNNGQIEYLPNDTEIAVLLDEDRYDKEKFGLLTDQEQGLGIEW